MTYPPINDLLKKTENRYTLAVEAAKRARQIIQGEQPLYEVKEKEGQQPKPLAIAIEEINRGLITYTKPNGQID
ncbi:MAG: DNA-directed RNA polymerase subunit omega [Clostridiales bacterium]|nr:DNA-directed RNA polymerase subunit omega [Clostridiales bacterium]